MPLREGQKREIAQLMFVALYYLDRASEAAHSTIKMGTTKDTFPLIGVVDDPTRQASILGADLASAATRLATVDHVLDAAKCAVESGRGDVYSQCRHYFYANSSSATADLAVRADWFHILLRDSIGHNEPDQSPTQQQLEQQNQRYRDRQNCIEKTTFGDAYARLRGTAVELGKVLTRYGIQIVR